VLSNASSDLREVQTATIKGFEVMRMIRPGHCLTCKAHVKDEVRFINNLFDVFTIAA
jgi:IS6 family transposase